MKKMNKFFTIIFIMVFVGLLFLSGVYALFNRIEINDYENREAYKLLSPQLESFLNGTYQDSLELALSDQIPKAIILKKLYNFGSSYLLKNITNLFVGKYCDNNYIRYSEDILTYGCDNNLVYSSYYFDGNNDALNSRIENTNKIIENINIPVYVFYVERDTDINFVDNSKANISNFIKNKLNTDNYYIYEINSFDEFKKRFYKTDHHWNYYGSYEAYKDLHEFLGLQDNFIKPKDTVCTKKKWAGSKARISGAQYIYGEKLCVYEFDFPSFKTYINKQEVLGYGVNNIKDLSDIGYGAFYGGDNGEVIIDYNQNEKENILLIGDSYDNALLKLIGLHFNKIYALDFRAYYNEVNTEFHLNEYIKENDIDKLVFLGNSDFFVDSTFNIEV